MPTNLNHGRFGFLNRSQRLMTQFYQVFGDSLIDKQNFTTSVSADVVLQVSKRTS